MPLQRGQRLYNLKRPKLRASWNKINLYNLSRFQSPLKARDRLFKQKWVSKSTSRKYHGEMLGETHWMRLFRPTVRAVMPMDPKALATDDGRAHAAGRGSGRDRLPDPTRKERGDRSKPIPYAGMVYAALERRLDVAVFRALFASSARQARQFCIHGFVKVNGHKMVYPGYMLNPGDMFQVDPERVMYATGAGKDGVQRREGRVRRRLAAKGVTITKKAKPAPKASEDDADTLETAEEPELNDRAALQKLLDTSKIIASNEPHASAKRKRALRDFTRLVRTTLSRTPKGSEELPSDATSQLQQLMATLNISVDKNPNEGARAPTSAAPSRDSTTSTFTDSTTDEPLDPTKPRPAIPLAETQTVRTHQRAQLAAALQEARDNPIDATKPYATPWQPRPYMSAFTFVPRYLEVHHAICAAIYLRHPVARPGLAEVPSPFDNEILALAHNWYLRRR